jgi:DNA polymerase V
MYSYPVMTPLQPQGSTGLIQWLDNKVSAGFPSPAEDFAVKRLDLDRLLNIQSEAVFFMRVAGNSMKNYGIFDGDIIVVNKGKRPSNGDIAVVALDREFLVKRVEMDGTQVTLKTGNPRYKDIVLQEGQELECWGVVTATIKVFPSGVFHVRTG